MVLCQIDQPYVFFARASVAMCDLRAPACTCSGSQGRGGNLPLVSCPRSNSNPNRNFVAAESAEHGTSEVCSRYIALLQTHIP